VARKRSKGSGGRSGQLDAYRRIRKPMPPPEQVIPDRRRSKEEELAHREAKDDVADRDGRTRRDEPDVP
jgi:hypothetical protein